MSSDKEETAETRPEVVDDSSAENIPQKAASESEVLKDVVALVDVRCGKEDWSDSIEVQLVRLGARIVKTFVSDLTHVVFKDGHRRTLNAALRRKVHLVNVLWIDSCKSKMYRDNEENFKVIIPEKPFEVPWYVKRVEKLKYLLDQKPDPWEELSGIKSTPPVSLTPAPKKATIDSYFATNSAGSAIGASKVPTMTPLAGRNTRRRSKLLLNVNQPEIKIEKKTEDDGGDYIDKLVCNLFSRIDTPNGPSAVEAITESLSAIKKRYNHLDNFRMRQNSPMSSACSSTYDDDDDAPYIPLMERCRAKMLGAKNEGESTPTASNEEPIGKPSFSAPSCLKSSQSSAEEKPGARKRKSSIGTGQNKRVKLDDSFETRVMNRRSSKLSTESTPSGSGLSRRRSERLVLKSSNLSSSQSSNNSDDIFAFCSSRESNEATPEKKSGRRNPDDATHRGGDASKTSTELCSVAQEVTSAKSNHYTNLGTHTIKEEEAEIELTDSKSDEKITRLENENVDGDAANIKAQLPQTALSKSTKNCDQSQAAPSGIIFTGKLRITQQQPSNDSGKSQATTLPKSFGQGTSHQQAQHSRKRKPDKKDVTRRVPGESVSPLKSKSILNYFSPFAGTILDDKTGLLTDDHSASQEDNVLVSTNLHQWEKDITRSATKELRSFSLSERVTRGCIVVTGSRRRTLKILNGIALGCWIVEFSWIQDSRREGRWLDLRRYEATNYFPACRENRIERAEQRENEKYSRNLFSCCGSIYVAPGCDPKKEELEQLIVICRGRISSSLRRAQICIGKPLRRAAVNVSEKWVLDSITENRCLEFDPYLLK